MLYLFIYLASWPFLKIASLFRGPTGGSLVIQTAKIGDYVNTTVLLEALGSADVVIDKINAPFAGNDLRVQRVNLINDHRGSLRGKLALALKLFRRRYDAVYVVMPGALNLFLGLIAMPRTTVTLRTYATGFTAGLLTAFFDRVIPHGRDDLTVDSYLKMPGGRLDSKSVWKLPMREKSPAPVCNAIADSIRRKAGICLGTGNKSKQIPADEWRAILAMLDEWELDVFVFGLETDNALLRELQSGVELKRARIFSLLGLIDLARLPANIARMNLFISSDTGLCYIADSYRVPLIVHAGPCHMAEQRPLNPRVLILAPAEPPPRASYIFDTLHHTDCSPFDCSPFYRTNEMQRDEMRSFISNVLADKP